MYRVLPKVGIIQASKTTTAPVTTAPTLIASTLLGSGVLENHAITFAAPRTAVHPALAAEPFKPYDETLQGGSYP